MSTKKYGLLGHPLGHSFSRSFHTERFARMGTDAVYENFDLPTIDRFPALIQNEPLLCGLNVTIPYKQQVMSFLDELSPMAERIGAVNVIKVEHLSDEEALQAGTHISGVRLTGYNSDIVGFKQSLQPLLDQAPKRPEHALILGTGGASKAVRAGLEDFGIRPTFVSRVAHPKQGILAYEDLTPEIMQRNLLIVNCTPLGMFPNVETCPAIPYELLTPEHICFDIVYNPGETLYMKKAAAQGAAVKCGQEMLEGQAVESYRLWTE